MNARHRGRKKLRDYAELAVVVRRHTRLKRSWVLPVRNVARDAVARPNVDPITANPAALS
jgi:hypothetical protein